MAGRPQAEAGQGEAGPSSRAFNWECGPANPLILDFQSSPGEGINFCCLKPSGSFFICTSFKTLIWFLALVPAPADT